MLGLSPPGKGIDGRENKHRGRLTDVNGVFLAHAGGVHEIAVLLGPVFVILVLLLVLVARRPEAEADEDETSEERAHGAGRDGDT